MNLSACFKLESGRERAYYEAAFPFSDRQLAQRVGSTLEQHLEATALTLAIQVTGSSKSYMRQQMAGLHAILVQGAGSDQNLCMSCNASLHANIKIDQTCW